MSPSELLASPPWVSTYVAVHAERDAPRRLAANFEVEETLNRGGAVRRHIVRGQQEVPLLLVLRLQQRHHQAPGTGSHLLS